MCTRNHGSATRWRAWLSVRGIFPRGPPISQAGFRLRPAQNDVTGVRNAPNRRDN